MVGVAVSIMSGLPDFAVSKPAFTAVVTATTFAINILLQVIAAMTFWKLGKKAAITIALVTGNTNVALVLAAIGASAQYELLVYFVVGQFPIYTLPLIMVPIYKRIINTK